MGTLIQFPEQPRGLRLGAHGEDGSGPATVIILPVVRIERYDDEQADGAARGSGTPARARRKRRRSEPRS